MSQAISHNEKNASEVLRVLEQKRFGKPVKDKVGLVVQGGGMMGVYSMGVLAALEEMGFGTCFDHVAGSSAGALNGAYFITGQAGYAVETYVKHLSTRKFVDPRRLNKMVDIDYLVDHIGKKERRLEIEKLTSSNTLLHIALTEFSNGKTRYVTNRTPGIDLWEAFRATAALPIFYNRAVKVGDGLYVDGSLGARVPVRRVVDFKCRYIVVVLTRHHTYRTKSANALIRALSWMATRNYSDALREAVFREDPDYNKMLSDLPRVNPRIPGYADRLVFITPQSRSDLGSMITTDPRQLMRCALSGRLDTWKAFGKTPPKIDNPFAQ